MNLEILAIGVSAWVTGAILVAVIALYLFRARVAVLSQERQLNEAIIKARLDGREQELSYLTTRLQSLQDRLALRETALQDALVSQATLRGDATSLQQQVTALETRLDTAGQLCEQFRGDNARHREEIARLNTTLAEQQKQSQEKLALLEDARERLNSEFRHLANEIFDSKQRVFKEQNQVQLDGLLKPLGERIKEFEKRVEESYSQESKERFSLIREVRSLQDLNARISKEAVNLTNALKGENRTQGTWGEVILERILEKSGLQKGREYDTQTSLVSEDGRRNRPDVIVHLPEGKDVIVDSKVSLVAYERFCSAPTDEARVEAAKAHIQSVRQHVKLLGRKDYQNLATIRTLDFVLLFIPVESAFAVAIQTDADLFAEAFEQNIMVVSPSTLLATLRMIHNIWRFEQQNKNAEEIARRAGALYDKFVNFVADLEEIGTKIGSAQATYDRAHNKLVSGKGNLVTRAEGMRELGAKVSKTLPQNLVEMPARQLLK